MSSDAPGDARPTLSLLDRIRSIVFMVVFFSLTAIMGVILLPVHLAGQNAIRATIRLWAKMMSALFRVLCGVRIKVVGAEQLPEGGAVVAANHQSMWETIAFFGLLKNPVMVFKKELLSIPIYRWWGLGGGGVAVDREAGPKAIRKLVTETKANIASGVQIVVFPEGTRTAPGTTAPLQPGVAAIYAASGMPCVPIVHNSGAHWLHPGPFKKPGVITVEVKPAIEAGLSRKAFMARLDAALRNDGREDSHSS